MKLKDLKINQVPFYYAVYEGMVEQLDSDGYKTGEVEVKYGEPTLAHARISPYTGQMTGMPFGADLTYDKAISTVQDLPIDEQTALWIDCKPTDEDGSLNPPDYMCVRPAKDLQQKVWAIRKIRGNQS